MIPEWNKTLFHEDEDGYQEITYKKPTEDKEKKLKILEVCYTSLANIAKKEQEKRDKYAPLLQRLIDKGYKPATLPVDQQQTSNKPATNQ